MARAEKILQKMTIRTCESDINFWQG